MLEEMVCNSLYELYVLLHRSRSLWQVKEEFTVEVLVFHILPVPNYYLFFVISVNIDDLS